MPAYMRGLKSPLDLDNWAFTGNHYPTDSIDCEWNPANNWKEVGKKAEKPVAYFKCSVVGLDPAPLSPLLPFPHTPYRCSLPSHLSTSCWLLKGSLSMRQETSASSSYMFTGFLQQLPGEGIILFFSVHVANLSHNRTNHPQAFWAFMISEFIIPREQEMWYSQHLCITQVSVIAKIIVP